MSSIAHGGGIRHAVVGGVLAVAALAGIVQACGQDRPEAGGAGVEMAGSVLAGACEAEGQRVSCHVETGRVGNVVNCFSGTQICRGGRWSACSGDGEAWSRALAEGAMTSPTDEHGGTSFKTVSASTPSPDAGGCALNPCNPDCVGVDVDADTLAPDGGLTTIGIQGSLIGYDSWPTAKKNALNPAPGWCASSVPAPTSGPTAYRECNYDYCCGTPDGGGATGTCIRWLDQGPDGGAGICNAPSGQIDFTVGVGCTDTSNHPHLPVCNRGQVDANSGSLVLIEWSSNPNQSGTASICQVPTSGSYGGKCTIDLATKPIKAGECIDVDTATPAAGITCNIGLFSSGNRAAMINPPSVASGGYGPYAQLAEADRCNNQTFVFTQSGTCEAYGIQPPPPANVSFTYVAVCQPGFRPQWNQFAYDATVPAISEVSFTARTAPRLSDGGAGTFGPTVTLATSANPGGPDPASCPMSGPSPCPKNLASLLGAASYDEVLEIGVGLVSTTAIPTVKGWQVTYNCVAAE